MDTVNTEVVVPPEERLIVDVLNEAVRPEEGDATREMGPEKRFKLFSVMVELLVEPD